MKSIFSSVHTTGKAPIGHSGKWQLPLLILLLLLLPALAALQHHYLGKLSEAEQLRLTTNLELMAKNFSEDFDSELTRIQQLFRFEEGLSGELESRLQQAYSIWKQDAPFPDMIRSIYSLEITNGIPSLYMFNFPDAILYRSDWPVELDNLKSMISEKSKTSASLLSIVRAPLLYKYPLIVTECLNCRIADNIVGLSPESFIGYIVIVLDPDVIQEGLIPTLSKRHFSIQSGLGIDILISKQNKPDDLFYISGPELDIDGFAHPVVRTEIGKWINRPPVTISTRVVYMKNRLERQQKEIKTAVAPGDVKPPVPLNKSKLLKIPADQIESWELMLKYHNNTLEGIVNRARRRNLLISYCTLAILGISMVMVFISTHRANALARRQLKFVSGVSHELRTPLSVIRSAGENLADGLITDTDQQKKYGSLIRDEGRRLSTMVENILSFSALQNDKTILNFRTIDIAPLLEACISGCSLSNERQKPNIMIESDNKVPPAKIDYDSMKIAFSNVIENALKYSPGGSPILIRILHTSPGSPIEITFEDQGRGIDPEDLPHILDPFFRGKNTEEQRTPGSGIGLSLVADIVKKHGGKIEVNSRRYKGTTVSIFLPAG